MANLQTEIRLNDKLCLAPDPNLLAALEPHQLVNSYTCPLGRAHGTAWLLMRRGDINDLVDENNFELKMTTDFTEDEGVTIPRLFFLEGTRISIGAPNDKDAPYLAQFVDVRYQLNKWSDSGELLANLRSGAQDADFLTGTTGSWNTFIGLLWTSMPALGNFPGGIVGEGDPESVPEGYDLRYENSWDALNTILGNLGKAVAYNPLEATFSIVTINPNAQEGSSAFRNRVLRETETIEHNATRTPATIRVVFNRWYKNYGQEEDTEINNWQSVADEAAVKVDISTNNASAVPGTILTLWDDLYATRDGTGIPDNTSELGDRAEARAAAWLADAEIERGQTVMVGFVTENLPGARIKSIQWRHLGGGPETVFTSISGQLTSEFKRPESMPTSMEELRSPNLSRRSFPNWPRLPNVVEVDDGSANEEPYDPNSNNLFEGFVHRIEGQITGSGTLQKKEPCWIRFIDDHDNLDGKVKSKNNDFFMGRLSGTAAVVSGEETDIRPLYVARHGAEAATSTILYGKANENWRKAGDDGSETLTGTFTATNNSPSITLGIGTLFLTEVPAGTTLLIDGANYNVLSIGSDTELTLTSNFTGATAAGYTVQKPALVGGAPDTPYVRVNPCEDVEGLDPDFNETNIVFWALFDSVVDDSQGPTQDPNVVAGQVIVYGLGPDGKHATQGYYDMKIGDAIFKTTTSHDDKQGWARMDGGDNSAANGGSGIDMSCFFPRGSTGEEAIGQQKGKKDHFHPVNHNVTPDDDTNAVQKWDGVNRDDIRTVVLDDTNFCSGTNTDNAQCGTCLPSECDCEGDGNPCDLPIQYVHLHYIERLDNNQGFTPP